MNPKPSFLRAVAFLAITVVIAASADAQSVYAVAKLQHFLQTGPNTIVADSTAPFEFSVSAPQAGTLTTPRGAKIPLAFNHHDNDYGFTRSFATKAALDAEFPNGAYTFSGAGIPTFNISITGDFYPNTPQLVGGNWNAGGALLLVPTVATTLTLNAFSNYSAAGTIGHTLASIGPLDNEVFSKSIPGIDLPVAAQPLTSMAVPAGTFTNNIGANGDIIFDAYTYLDTTTLPGSFLVAAYESSTHYIVAALSSGTGGNPPTITQQPVNQVAALGGKATFSIAVTTANAPGQGPFFDWRFNGESINPGNDPKYSMAPNGNLIILTINDVTASDAGNYAVRVGNTGGNTSSNVAVLTVNAVASQPLNQTVAAGQNVTITTTPAAGATLALQWAKNGTTIQGATNSNLTLNNLQPADTGIYLLNVTSAGVTVPSRGAIVGLSSTSKLIGPGTEFPDIFHPVTGFTYDQILLQGPAATVTADSALNQILRISYIDLNDDIVQVEFAGPGALTLVLDNVSGPATPLKYNQSVAYMKGHAGIVVTGATENTNLSIFSVGTLVNGNPALYRSDVTYDGFADLAFVAISSANGKFGGLRSANASYFATKGYTGVYAPGVEFTGPVFVGDINAADAATPVLVFSTGPDIRITGGDLQQSNGSAVQVGAFTQLKFMPGTNSHGVAQPAQANKARLERSGVDVTAQIVVDPTP